ncbi:hypothetical protein V1286_003400 [Bradyrhizobium algeriense]|uniref:Uncharacterized protein n=1 Tax=Bradyrhizobium algeriense TaxID=634784 RepID=A0ABU8BBE8_9BRAD
MSRNWTLLILILFLGSSGTLQAEPLDSPGVVYIDGQPCNRACQSYMDWSYRALSARRHEERDTSVAGPDEVEIERVEPAARPRSARHAAPVARSVPHAGKAASNGKAPGTKASNSKKIAAPNAAPQAAGKEIPAVTAAVTTQKAAGETAAAVQKPEPKVEGADQPAQTAVIAAPQPDEAPVSKAAAPEVKPEAKAEVVLPPPATLDVAAAPAAPAPAMASSKAREIGKAASSSLDDPDNLVALVLARPEINSLSDLNNKTIAITEKQSASSGRVSAALMAAGAAEVQFSEVKASAIDRLISGEVPAAVVLATREVANLFPEVEGFRTFRVPLKARL